MASTQSVTNSVDCPKGGVYVRRVNFERLRHLASLTAVQAAACSDREPARTHQLAGRPISARLPGCAGFGVLNLPPLPRR
jgi:hypothetical protein